MNEATQVAMEEWVIDYLDKLRKQNGMTVEKWATLVYPDSSPSAARMKIQGLRKPQGSTGKRKRLVFSEFTRMARAVGISPSEVCALAENAFGVLADSQKTVS